MESSVFVMVTKAVAMVTEAVAMVTKTVATMITKAVAYCVFSERAGLRATGKPVARN